MASLAFVACTARPSRESCRETATLGGVTYTLQDARTIRTAVETYLRDEKPAMDESAPPVGEPFVDCAGTMRMGAWILESTSSPPDLQLTYRIATTPNHLVRQQIHIVREGAGWKAVSTGRVISHLGVR